MDKFNKKSIDRAIKAIKCLDFNAKFYEDITNSGLNAEKILEMNEIYLSKYKKKYNNADKIENNLQWLITIGILRREVDGQGLTSRVRLTPLGRKIINQNPELANGKGLFFERISQYLFRKINFK